MVYIPSIKLSVPADLRYSSLVRTTAKNAFIMAKLPSTWEFRLTLVVDELFMNAVKYGSASIMETVMIQFFLKKDRIVVSIDDSGTNKDHAKSPQSLRRIINKNFLNNDLLKLSGRGLAMFTKSWTDRLFITKSEYGGIRVRFEKQLVNCIKDTNVYKYLEFSTNDPKTITIHLKDEMLDVKNIQELEQTIDLLDNYKGYNILFDMNDLVKVDDAQINKINSIYTKLANQQGSVKMINLPVVLKEKFLKIYI